MAFTQEEIEQMRQIVGKHDLESGKNAPKEFDLNNPPQKPYQFKEFPKIMYHHEQRVHASATSAEHQEELEAAGYSTEPFPREAQIAAEHAAENEFQLDSESAEEIAEINQKIRKKK